MELCSTTDLILFMEQRQPCGVTFLSFAVLDLLKTQKINLQFRQNFFLQKNHCSRNKGSLQWSYLAMTMSMYETADHNCLKLQD